VRRVWLLVLVLGCSLGAQGSEDAVALRAPGVWGPLLTAAVLAGSPADERLSRWARRATPLFGGTTAARRASDGLLFGSLGLALGSTWLIPQRERRWSPRVGGVLATGGTVFLLKRFTGRSRPDRADDLSFPSGHAALAFAGAALTQDALARSHLAPGPRRALGLAAWGMAAATAWARVEAGAHYPSDVVVGAVLGGVIARLVLAGGEIEGLGLDLAGPSLRFRYVWHR